MKTKSFLIALAMAATMFACSNPEACPEGAEIQGQKLTADCECEGGISDRECPFPNCDDNR